MARHRAVDLVRSDLRRVARQERSYRLTPVPPAAGAGDVVMAAETVGLVRAAVQLLPDSQRQVVELAYFKGLTRREVAPGRGHPGGHGQVTTAAGPGQAGRNAGPPVAGVIMTAPDRDPSALPDRAA